MKIVRLEQGSAAWHAWRKDGIGGSDANVLMECDFPWDNPATPRFLWEIKTDRTVDEPSTFAMRRGLRFEPEIRDWYERRTGLRMANLCGEHDVCPWIRASLDGLDEWGELVLEIKAPRIESHLEALDNNVPAYYWPQVQHQLLVTGAKRLHYLSYSEKKGLPAADRFALVDVDLDADFVKRLLAREWEFWGRVQADWWPEDERRPALSPQETVTHAPLSPATLGNRAFAHLWESIGPPI